jgi:molybdopterin-dependent oxidoreductase alpha subunit
MAKRGIPIVTFNPLKERALLKFTDPQSPVEMLTGTGQEISSNYFQLRTGGDIMALQGVSKVVIEADDVAKRSGSSRVLDVNFIETDTHGFEAYADYVRALEWPEIEHYTALSRQQIEQAAQVYMKAERVIICWGMGITQHRNGGDAMQQIINLLLLRGNIGRLGAGASPIRGHSNVQGDRTVGIYQKPKESFLTKMDEVFGFVNPREGGHDTVECCEAILRGEVDAFLGMGGNFFRAIPDFERITARVCDIQLTVQIATKLNRSHLIHGKQAYILPALGRTEIDIQSGIKQTVTVEDSFSMVHASTGQLTPASEHCRSEPWIVAGLAKATIKSKAAIDWDALVANYDLIRDKIEAVLPDMFTDYNARIREPGGFHLPNGARDRTWNTPTGKANFLFKPGMMDEDDDAPQTPHLQLMTVRSHDQFNTTIYSYNDRYRDISNDRMVVFMNTEDMIELGISKGSLIEFSSAINDGIERRASGFRVVPYEVPRGCCAAYYPETNNVLPLSHHDQRSHTPAAKSVPVTIKVIQPPQAVMGRDDGIDVYRPMAVPIA